MFLLDVSCNLGNNVTVPEQIVNIIRPVINLIKIAIPILLIIWGMLDLGKAVMAQKEDEIKKGQQTFVKRVIAAVIVFLIIAIVQLVMGLVDGGEAWECACEIIGGSNCS